jgi:NADH:ubiquinone oxidoreductase subunit E
MSPKKAKKTETAPVAEHDCSCRNEMDEVLDKIFEQYPHDESSLIMILQEIQDQLNWLPADSLQRVACELKVPKAKVMGVATFYKAFSLEPRGKKLIKVCLGTACHVRGAAILVDELERQLNVKEGKGVTEDGAFSLEAVNCVGACALAPAIVVGEEYYANVKPGGLGKLLKMEQPK